MGGTRDHRGRRRKNERLKSSSRTASAPPCASATCSSRSTVIEAHRRRGRGDACGADPDAGGPRDAKPPVLALAALQGRLLGRLVPSPPRRQPGGRGGCSSPNGCTTRRCPPWPGQSPDAVDVAPRRTSASGSSRTASSPPTWSRETAGSPRLRSGPGHRFSFTATCSSTHVFAPGDEISGVIDWSDA